MATAVSAMFLMMAPRIAGAYATVRQLRVLIITLHSEVPASPVERSPIEAALTSPTSVANPRDCVMLLSSLWFSGNDRLQRCA